MADSAIWPIALLQMFRARTVGTSIAETGIGNRRRLGHHPPRCVGSRQINSRACPSRPLENPFRPTSDDANMLALRTMIDCFVSPKSPGNMSGGC
jgi:hypothetical protein